MIGRTVKQALAHAEATRQVYPYHDLVLLADEVKRLRERETLLHEVGYDLDVVQSDIDRLESEVACLRAENSSLRKENAAMRPSRLISDAPKVGELVALIISTRDIGPLDTLFQMYGYYLTEESDCGMRVGEWAKFKADVRGVVNALLVQLSPSSRTENLDFNNEASPWEHR